MAFEQGYYNLARFIGKNYAETDVLNCFRVFVPDGDEYKAQLLTLINVAATRAAWWTETDEQRETRAAIWQRAYEETIEHMDCGCGCCDWLIECLSDEAFLEALDAAIAGLLNNPASATRAAVYNTIQQMTGNGEGTELSSSSKTEPLNQGSETCDKDSLYGSCVHTVTTLNRLNQDFLETIEALTDNQEMLAYFVSAIPLVSELPIDEAIQFAAKIREFVQEFYLAGYDVDLESEMICALFCAAVANDCVLNMNVITDYFWNKASLFPPFDGTNVFTTALDILEACANWEEMTGEAVVFCMMAANTGFLNYLNGALGMDFGHFKLQAKAGIPSDDWMIFCEDCPEPVAPALGITPGAACLPGTVYGENLAYNSGSGIWEADGLVDPTTNTMRVAIVRSDGGLFQFNTFTSTPGIGGAGWVLEDDTCVAGAGLMPPEDTNLKCMLFAIANNGTPLHIGFNFISID